MKRVLQARLYPAACLLAAATALTAAPLQRADVINNPAWVLHFDADALRHTVVGQHLFAEMEKPEAQKKFTAFQAIADFDPRKSVHGVTLYGSSKAEEDGVLMIYADVDAGRLTALAQSAEDHRSDLHRQHTIHNWIDQNKKGKEGVKPRTYAALYGSRIVLFGQKESRVAEALDVLDRALPNLLTNPRYAKLGSGPAIIQGAACKPELPANDPNAAVFRQSKMVTVDVAETQQQLQATLTLETEGEETARQIEVVGRGLIGLMALQKDKPDSARLARALSVQQAGVNVAVGLSLPAAEVVEMMKAAEARKQAAVN